MCFYLNWKRTGYYIYRDSSSHANISLCCVTGVSYTLIAPGKVKHVGSFLWRANRERPGRINQTLPITHHCVAISALCNAAMGHFYNYETLFHCYIFHNIAATLLLIVNILQIIVAMYCTLSYIIIVLCIFCTRLKLLCICTLFCPSIMLFYG